MAIIKVKKIRINGKLLDKINGHKIKRVICDDNVYELLNEFNLTINTNNEYDESEVWSLEENTYVSISDSGEYIKAGNKTIYAGSKEGYEFNGWDKSSFNITEDTTVEGLWSRIPIGSATIITRWYGTKVYIYSISLTGKVNSCSLSEGYYWTLLENETISLTAEFYDSNNSLIDSKTLNLGPYSLSQIIPPVDYVEESFNYTFY